MTDEAPDTASVEVPTVPPPPANAGRPPFLDAVSTAYSDRGKGVVVLSGNTHDLFFSPKVGGKGSFLELEQTIFREWRDKFHVVRLDISTGIDFYDEDADLSILQGAINLSDKLPDAPIIGNLKSIIKETRHSPLPALVLLRDMLEAVTGARRILPQVKKVLTVIQLAGSLFPQGDFDRLGELDRQRLVTFLNMIESPSFKNSGHLVILVADTRSEINRRIIGLPSVAGVELDLPNEEERRRYVTSFMQTSGKDAVRFEKGADAFGVETTGLKLTNLQDIMEAARRTRQVITSKQVNEVINDALESLLGGVVRVKRPGHTFADVIGYKSTCEILRSVMRRCESPSTAVSGVLIVGPNGTGKTYLMEAAAAESGRVVIELVGLRGSYFGETDAFFEKFWMVVRTFGKIGIFIDEAATAFGSVHRADTHETEKRLAGNIIKLMGDPTMKSKAVWFLMTSRPDELDPDVKSRCPIQIPVFDQVGEERSQFLVQMLERKKLPVPEGVELEEVLHLTSDYSNRDLDFLVAEVMSSDDKSVRKTLDFWQASCSIKVERELQKMIAAQHCSYPSLLPGDLKAEVRTPEFNQKVQALRALLYI
jgi:ATP-dependent 26S proteasome regulatory subunit